MTAGNENVNQVIVILLRTGMTVGSVIALVLDNVIPGKLTGLHLQCMFYITQYPFAKTTSVKDECRMLWWEWHGHLVGRIVTTKIVPVMRIVVYTSKFHFIFMLRFRGGRSTLLCKLITITFRLAKVLQRGRPPIRHCSVSWQVRHHYEL